MQLEEHYILEHVRADGKVDVDTYDDPAEALREYGAQARDLARGERVKLHRYSTVVLVSSIRAK
ncbi:hypothetical protein AB0I84_18820 [Streptomyces spectabilis]|uniref:hypothetical protein n=1 Tax=Streptomyces spectabilis TaxID=68270 RepID=UPI0033C3ACB3